MNECQNSPILMLSNNAVTVFMVYVILRLVMRQPDNIAKTRAIFVFLVVSLYTNIFGYGFPNKRNPLLFG
jgi:hypothetical protein